MRIDKGMFQMEEQQQKQNPLCGGTKKTGINNVPDEELAWNQKDHKYSKQL